MENYFEKLLKPLKNITDCKEGLDTIRKSLIVINQYFYNSYDGIGSISVDELGLKTEYFSEFHKLWSEKSEDILAPSIDEKRCESVAEVLHNVRIKFGDSPFILPTNHFGLDKGTVAKIRFLTANQDFRGSRDTESFFQLYNKDPNIFDLQVIKNNSAAFLKNLGISDLSQNDKREKFAETVVEFLLGKGIDVIDIADYYNNDCLKIKNALVTNTGMGYGNKKADMFIRDMYEWDVWPSLKNVYEMNVASDINTIKVSLRTGILKTKLTPLLSSLLDIYCYQYSIIDDWTAKGWKRVWEIWKEKHPKTAPYGPAFFDYFLYDIVGKDFCKENLYLYKSSKCNHSFYYHTGMLKHCLSCKDEFRNNKITYSEVNGKTFANCEKHSSHKYEVENKRKKKCNTCEETPLNETKVIKRLLPCSHLKGKLKIKNSKYVIGNDAVLPGIEICPFECVCKSSSVGFKKLNPPKSISILGRTGWESAKTKINEGGGGLMA